MAMFGDVVQILSGKNADKEGTIVGGDGSPWVIKLHTEDGKQVKENDDNVQVYDSVVDPEAE